ncbi:MAG: peroxisome- protein [Vezdaea aestivalis]|nr:MAG: peroxisome- protein [Vezdaea aestivalis]
MSSNATPGGEDPSSTHSFDTNSPTIAQFSPVTLSQTSASTKQRSTILVHQKSPLLVATPPQITRVLAYSHPFILPLNKLVGLLSWTSGDPWESFLLVAGFWAIVLYGNTILHWAGPVVLVTVLIICMYIRRFSPLSSASWNDDKGTSSGGKGHSRQDSDGGGARHHKTLDEIVETLKVFTARCNALLLPAFQLTDFLSTQRTATSATTRPALTSLFLRLLLITPLWMVLALPQIRLITTRRVVLTVGTMALTWHSRPARVSRTILWRSSLIRRIVSSLTGLKFVDPLPQPRPATTFKGLDNSLRPSSATQGGRRRPNSPGVRFTFALYENQRRWLGLGWTSSLFSYERVAWTDEHLNPSPPRSDFTLPIVDDGNARWRWVSESQWRVEGALEGEEGGPIPDGSKHDARKDQKEGLGGWIYYDNKWRDGRRGQDGWGRYTRRRKWYRDAELVEVTASTEITPSPTPVPDDSKLRGQSTATLASSSSAKISGAGDNSSHSDSDTASSDVRSKRRWFRKNKKTSRAPSVAGSEKGSGSFKSASERAWEDDPGRVARDEDRDWGGGIGDDARMAFG